MATETKEEQREAKAQQNAHAMVIGQAAEDGILAGLVVYARFPEDTKHTLALGSVVGTFMALALDNPAWAEAWMEAAGVRSPSYPGLAEELMQFLTLDGEK